MLRTDQDLIRRPKGSFFNDHEHSRSNGSIALNVREKIDLPVIAVFKRNPKLSHEKGESSSIDEVYPKLLGAK